MLVSEAIRGLGTLPERCDHTTLFVRFLGPIRRDSPTRVLAPGIAVAGTTDHDRDLTDRGTSDTLGERIDEAVGKIPKLTGPRGIVDRDPQHPAAQSDRRTVRGQRCADELDPRITDVGEVARLGCTQLASNMPERVINPTETVPVAHTSAPFSICIHASARMPGGKAPAVVMRVWVAGR